MKMILNINRTSASNGIIFNATTELRDIIKSYKVNIKQNKCYKEVLFTTTIM